MKTDYDLVIYGGQIVNHTGCFKADLAIQNGTIKGVGQFKPEQAEHALNAEGLHVLPGVIDSQVHFREPGLDWKEDLQTGSLAAIKGGVTSVFEMPNTQPPTTNKQAFHDKLNRAKGRMHCDYAFYGGASQDNIDDLAELENMPGCCGIKVFMGASTGSLLVDDDASLFEILKRIQRRAAFHSEDEARLQTRKELAIEGDWTSHMHVRDAKAALISTQRLVRLARKAGKRIHILHISTREEIEFLLDHKDIVSLEVTPQHLTLTAPQAYQDLKAFAQMNPPIRDQTHQDRLWSGVRQGIIDVLGSDHAPHTREEKSKPYPNSPSGMPGVQTLVPVMLDQVNQGKLTLQHFVDLTAHSPARIFQIMNKGRLAVGYDADLTLVDLKKTREVEESWLVSKCGWSPFTGQKLTGWPEMTIVRGRIVMREGDLIEAGKGAPVQFLETLNSDPEFELNI